MAKKPSKTLKKPVAADVSAFRPAADFLDGEPARQPRQVGLAEATVPEAQSATPIKATPAPEPAHLLTPLAVLWPNAPPPEPPKSLEKAPVAGKTEATAAHQTVKVTFVLLDLGAKQVSLCGDFNAWAADAAPMKRDADGLWDTTITLAPGRYEYKFLVDGQWLPDPQAREQVWNRHGTLNSVIEVRA